MAKPLRDYLKEKMPPDDHDGEANPAAADSVGADSFSVLDVPLQTLPADLGAIDHAILVDRDAFSR